MLRLKSIFLLLFLTTTLFSNEVILTKKEKEFLNNHPSIVIGTDANWAPYVIPTDAYVIGYDSSILERINELTGSNFKLITGKWKELVEKAKNKEIDGLSTSAVHEERKKFFNFSNVYMSSYRTLMISKENPKNISSISDLDGKTVTMQEGNLFDKRIISKLKNVNVVKTKTSEEQIDLLIKGKVDAVLSNESIHYLQNVKHKLAYTKIIDIFQEPRLDLVFSIRNDWPEAVSIINKALNAMGDYELEQLRKEWFISQKLFKEINKKPTSREINLTSAEKSLLDSYTEITMCIDPDWMPFEKNDNGKHIGMTADYFKILQKKIQKPIKMIPTQTWIESLEFGKQRKCDIFSLVMPTPERLEYLSFTKPYLNIPLVIATKTNEVFVNDITKVTKRLGIVKGYAYGEILKTKYPNLKLIHVENINNGLSKVEKGELYGFIGTLSTVGHHIQQRYISQLKIAGKFDENWSLGVGIRNDKPLLLSIFDKAISSINEEDHQKILNKWLSVKYEEVTFKYILEIIIVSLIIILIVLFINRRLSKEVKRREKAEKSLKLVIKSAQLGTWAWNPQNNQNIINEKWAEIIGYTKKEIDDKNDPFSFIFEEDLKKIHKAFEKHTKEKTENFEVEFRMLAKDGSLKWIYSNGSIVKKDKDNEAILVTGIHQDITNRKLLEAEVDKKTKLMLKQSRQAAMGEMLENIAHQWRQPLSVITTAASGVKLRKEINNLDDNDLINYMDQILKSGSYLSQTIEDFRSFFKDNKIASTFKLDTLFENSLQFLNSKIINRDIKVIKSIKDDTIHSYENELIQALINIFNNAVDALEKTTNNRYILIDEFSDDKVVSIVIKDTAGGIDEKIISKIFDPYFTTKDKTKGTGIGLHMTKEIIENHLKGKITASNEQISYKNQKYNCAVFTIEIPKNS